MSAWKIVYTGLLVGLVAVSVGQTEQNWRNKVNQYLMEQQIQIDASDILVVSLVEQCMYVLQGDSVVQQYEISGAALGAGNQSGSNQTPLGLHRIKEKYGAGVPLGGIMKSRQFTGELARIYTDPTDVEEDHVTTRVLWLEGMEPGRNKGGNVDSYQRYIYIHGTPEEGLIGQPASHGCIRMFNKEVVELYDASALGRLVLIFN